jgi:hypothetical protein
MGPRHETHLIRRWLQKRKSSRSNSSRTAWNPGPVTAPWVDRGHILGVTAVEDGNQSILPRQMVPPSTTGEDHPRPGIAAFQTMFDDTPQFGELADGHWGGCESRRHRVLDSCKREDKTGSKNYNMNCNAAAFLHPSTTFYSPTRRPKPVAPFDQPRKIPALNAVHRADCRLGWHLPAALGPFLHNLQVTHGLLHAVFAKRQNQFRTCSMQRGSS